MGNTVHTETLTFRHELWNTMPPDERKMYEKHAIKSYNTPSFHKVIVPYELWHRYINIIQAEKQDI